MGALLRGREDLEVDCDSISLEKLCKVIIKHPRLLGSVADHLVNTLYEGQWQNLVANIVVLDMKLKEVVPELLEAVDLSGHPNELSYLIENTVSNFESDNLLNLRILAAAWTSQPKAMEAESERVKGATLLDITLKEIVRICRDENMAVRQSATTLVFEMLNELASKRCPQSPALYKLLTYSFIENFSDDLSRQTMSQHFIQLFLKHKSIPVAILLEPLLR